MQICRIQKKDKNSLFYWFGVWKFKDGSGPGEKKAELGSRSCSTDFEMEIFCLANGCSLWPAVAMSVVTPAMQPAECRVGLLV